uniref:Uncharacterized protein n=1 Tax=viral metagenome TaxID=1070528 RepID=A0A6M3LP53_9ZZZZ
MEHLCDTCLESFPVCNADKILRGIDVNPEARGAEADTVIECDTYHGKEENGQFGVGA